ncbi:DMT family transporter [Cognatishimia activa]|uniref:Carboxylate/amino acid/amine transporter n=1 Tax=Cognatishimia activa TaxID=1715691 RepID=A0A0P1IP64_9RHOB|nr:DMT family transporter [Cognatishimia activa]CUJ24462.1 carboxylate/amino acid/amine transporter [Cognatishimia activa]CUK25361.1 carboxylate/amino acid/amine transporter [Cognatishimia activa]
MSPYVKAALWMSGAIVSFMSMAVAGRSASAELDTFEIMTYRSFIGLFIMALAITATGRWNRISTRNLKLHTFRNVSHFTGQNLWFYALTLMPMAQLFAFEFTTPIWVILLSPLMLGTKLRWPGLMAALLAFVGILIITRPGAEPFGAGVWAGLGCAIGFALTYFYTKKLLEHESIYAILFMMTAMQAAFSVIFAGYDGDIAWPTNAMIAPLLVVSITGLVAHLCISMALKFAPASVCAPIEFFRLPAIAVVGAMLYNEPLDPLVLIGAIFIFGGNYLNILSEMKSDVK